MLRWPLNGRICCWMVCLSLFLHQVQRVLVDLDNYYCAYRDTHDGRGGDVHSHRLV